MEFNGNEWEWMAVRGWKTSLGTAGWNGMNISDLGQTGPTIGTMVKRLLSICEAGWNGVSWKHFQGGLSLLIWPVTVYLRNPWIEAQILEDGSAGVILLILVFHTKTIVVDFGGQKCDPTLGASGWLESRLMRAASWTSLPALKAGSTLNGKGF